MIWLTGDEHFGHHNSRGGIIKYCNRPFTDVMQMERELIKIHNSVVADDDLVYHLGDFALWRGNDRHRVERIFKQLNGSHILILGNHDKLTPFQYVDIGFLSVHTSLEVDGMILVHDPSVCCTDRTKPFLAGHVHNHWKQIKNAINVGVDVWNYAPVDIHTISIMVKDWSENHSITRIE